MRQFIGYYFFHTIRRIGPRDARDAFVRTARAMKTFVEPSEPKQAGLTLDAADGNGRPLDRACSLLCESFGPIDRTIPGLSLAEGPVFRAYRWVLGPGRVQEALSLADEIQRDSPLAIGRVGVSASWQFRFKDKVTGTVLPHQDDLPALDVRLPAGSSLELSTGLGVRVMACLLFPFNEPSEEFREYASAFQAQSIFKFLQKHWRIWQYSKNGKWRQRRLDFLCPLEG